MSSGQGDEPVHASAPRSNRVARGSPLSRSMASQSPTTNSFAGRQLCNRLNRIHEDAVSPLSLSRIAICANCVAAVDDWSGAALGGAGVAPAKWQCCPACRALPLSYVMDRAMRICTFGQVNKFTFMAFGVSIKIFQSCSAKKKYNTEE